MIYKTFQTNNLGETEMFVWYNGSLLYKRWMWLSYGQVMYNSVGE